MWLAYGVGIHADAFRPRIAMGEMSIDWHRGHVRLKPSPPLDLNEICHSVLGALNITLTCGGGRQHRIMKKMADPEAAVAIVRARAPEESILLIRRTERVGDPWSGHWSLPGGRRDPQDSDLLHTALRELAEECAILLTADQLECALPESSVGRLLGPRMLVAPFVFSVDHELPTIADPKEAVEAVWVPVRVLRDPSRHTVQSVPGMPAEMQFPGIELNGVPLWGFTYKLVTGWLGVK